MAHGKLGVSNLAADTNTTVYTAASTCVMAKVTLYVSNRSESAAAVDIAISSTPASVGAGEWIETGTTLSAGGVYTLTDLILSPSEAVVVKSNKANVTVRVMGSELTKV